eukprot:327310-Pleurochrysis_carterae.AAC.7
MSFRATAYIFNTASRFAKLRAPKSRVVISLSGELGTSACLYSAPQQQHGAPRCCHRAAKFSGKMDCLDQKITTTKLN